MMETYLKEHEIDYCAGFVRTKEVVKKYLEENECTGLRNKDWGCQCSIKDLIPCYKLWWSKAMASCQTTKE